ncbi:conserved hypothetical protein [Candidatus Desulfosporosinus infrequens]|uniref:Uncharacterized protein n=1 Tax=Candidatus Desulfosporosinus infrequens TaxID=2043169 RepID=A0A2U3LM06_9FIRM|nr:conserved hypothetical protein [Candidatus Desulfosporosinus infrequens]
MRKNYFAKLVNYMKYVYHLKRGLNKLSDGRVNLTYSIGVKLFYLCFLVLCKGNVA